MRKNVFLKNLKDTKSFELQGPMELIDDLRKHLIGTGDYTGLGIFDIPNGTELCEKTENSQVEAVLRITCDLNKYSTVKGYISRYFKEKKVSLS